MSGRGWAKTVESERAAHFMSHRLVYKMSGGSLEGHPVNQSKYNANRHTVEEGWFIGRHQDCTH